MCSRQILVVGSSNTDMVIRSGRIPKPGETILGGDFMMNPGGKGANQAVAAAKLGGDVTFIARVGDDLFGKAAMATYANQGIHTSFIKMDTRHPSGVAMIMVDNNGENCISVAMGANASMENTQIDEASEILERINYVLVQLEIPIPVVSHLVETANKHDVKVILNPAPACPLEDSLLKGLHMITPNESEAELLTGIKVIDKSSAFQAASHLKSRGVDTVIITLGASGAYVLSDELNEVIPANRVKAIDTTAAGDTFNGALIVGLSEQMPLKEAITFANKAAALSVTKMGAQNSIPSRKEIN